MSIKMDDIPYDLHTMVDIIGMENFEQLTKFYGGITIYIPVHRRVIVAERNREIIRQYDGNNLDELRVKFGLTKQYIKRILIANDIEC